MHSRGARLARGWVVGAFATAVAALSHALAGGDTPSGLALVCGVVFAGLLATLTSGRTPSLPRLTVAVVGGQFAFHFAFSYLSVPASAVPVSATSMAMHHHPMAGIAAATVHHHPVGPGMWIAHAVAAAATLVFLRFAERAVWSLLTQIVDRAVRPFRAGRPLPVRARRVPPLAVIAPSLLVSRLSDRAVSRRGPPVSAAF